MKNILIPIDFSAISSNAIDYAVTLFKDTKIDFYFLTVYISTPSKLLGDDYNDEWFGEMDDDANIQLEELVNNYTKKSRSNHRFIPITKSDSIINAIKTTVEAKAIDLVITGTKGVSSFKDTFIGSNSLKMINTINNCPILVVPASYASNNLKQITFSTNYKRNYNYRELKSLITLGMIKHASIEVVCLSEEDFLSETQKTNKANLLHLLGSIDTIVKKLEWEDSETTSIEKHMKSSKSELLTLINHKHNFFHRLTEENVIKKTSFHSKVPLLILPEVE